MLQRLSKRCSNWGGNSGHNLANRSSRGGAGNENLFTANSRQNSLRSRQMSSNCRARRA